MQDEGIKEKVREAARNNFRGGANCAESVLLALLESGLIEMPLETVAVATAFGGGIGLTGGVCGALAGAVMGVSAAHGRKKPLAGTQQEIIDRLYGNPGLYRFFNQIPYKFQEKFGALTCAELNKDYSEWFNKDRFRNCMNITIETAAMAVDFILQGKNEGYTQPFGKNLAGKE
ncbi:MAG: hypothetical protein HPY50_21535 [Firmicutes bacterium]|nr:hypothetical protein [Bacillota bacterium]